MSKEDFKVSEEVALLELKAAIEYHLAKEITETEVREQYSAALRAVRRGFLTFDDQYIPTLELKEPILTQSGDVDYKNIVLKTRIFPSEQAKLAHGMDISKDSFKFSHKCISFIAGFPTVAYLDKLSKEDYTVLSQLGAVFM